MSVNNDLQKSLLDSMQLLAQNSADQATAVKSIKATVKSVKDAGVGIYELNYGGNVIEASSANRNVSYQVGDNVYVLIPDGDFSQSKIIIGLVASHAANYSTIEADNHYTVVSDNLLSFVGDGLIKLKSWIDESNDVKLDNTNFNILFPSYLSDGDRTFVFKAKVKTDIDKDHQSRGNYGLILSLPFKDAGTGSPAPVLCSMDVNTMQGNPYSFTTEQDVNLYFTVKDGLVYDSDSKPELLAFVEGFGYAAPREMEYDIYFKNVQIQMVEEIPESAISGYYLSLVSNKGKYFTVSDSTDKILTPKLKLNGKDTDVSSWECYWFAEDASIKNDSDGYTSIGGLGWKCLNNKTNVSYDDTGKQNYLYAVNKYSYAAKVQDVVSQLRYKCVLIQDDVVVSAFITLRNLTNNISMELVSKTGSNTYVENIGNVRLIARLKYPSLPASYTISTIWQRYDQNGNYLDDNFYSLVRNNDPNGDNLETEIYFPCSLVDQANIISCTFYCSVVDNGVTVKKNLGTAQIKIYTTAEIGYSSYIENGDVVYKYDSDGDSPLTANYDGPVNSRITAASIKPLVFRIFKEDGRELEEDEYEQVNYHWAIPVNSLIVLNLAPEEHPVVEGDYYILEGNGHKSINYTIANSFSKRKNDNTVLFSADFAGNKIQAAAAIKFLKDGESGTNGTKYTALVTHKGYSYNEKDSNGLARKVIMLSQGSNWYLYNQDTKRADQISFPISVQNSLFSIKVYSNGVDVTNSINSSVTWQMFDEGLSSDKNRTNFTYYNGELRLKENWNNNYAPYTNVVQAKVVINIADSGNASEVIYAYYPIEIIRFSNYVTSSLTGRELSIPQVTGGFDNVTYASDGKNPQYDDSTSFKCDYANSEDLDQLYGYSWTVGSSGNITIKEQSGNTAKATPVNNFESGVSKNYIQVDITSSKSQSDMIDVKAAEYDAQIEEKTTLKSKYQSNQTNMQSLIDFLENFSYNSNIEKLKSSQLLLLYRYKCIRVVDYLNNVLKEQIYDYCNGKIDSSYFNYLDFYNNSGDKLTIAYKQLYNLLTDNTLSNIDNLQSLVTIVDERLKDVDLSAYTQLSSLINQWNTQITAVYKNAYDMLIVQSGLGNLQSLTGDLIDFTQNQYLLALEDIDTQEFENLCISVNAFIGRLSDDISGQINSYDDYVNGVLNPLYNLFIIYQKADYQDYYYNNIYDDLDSEIKALQKEYDTYNESLTVSTTTDVVTLMTYVKPIVMLFNRYEMSYLNDWDGNKLYTGSGDDDSEYLFAPQVGAGKMELDQSTNTHQFTGIIIGVKKSNRNIDKIGLFGYGKGAQSIFLDANSGTAEFGASGKGQIIIQPGEAPKIYTANHKTFSNSSNGAGFYIGEEGISLGSGNPFKVDKDGKLNATQATIKGNITADSGKIGGWWINSNKLQNTNPSGGGTPTVYLNSSGNSVDNPNIYGAYIQGGGIKGSNISGGSLSISGTEIASNGILTLNYQGSSGDKKKVFFKNNGTEIGYIKYGKNMLNGNDVTIIAKGTNATVTLGTEDAINSMLTIWGNKVTYAGKKLATEDYVDGHAGGYNNIDDSQNGEWSEGTKHIVVNRIREDGNTIVQERYTGYVSDIRLKEKISKMPDFSNVYMKLCPLEYEYHMDLNCLDGGWRHYGIIAQDFHRICDEEGIDLYKHAIWHKRSCVEHSNEDKYVKDKVEMFEKDELHALHIQMIQKQQHQIEALQEELQEIKEKLNNGKR